jgi:SAM-dependent methyltransferase
LIEADLAQDLPPLEQPFDAALAFDLIEHLDDDRATVARLARLLAPGGAIVIGVPALPELFSEFDRVQGHRRRYLPATLRQAFAGSGLRVERILWWGSWLRPLLRRQRNSSRGRPGESPADTYRRYLELPPWPAAALLRLALAIEQARTLSDRSKIGTSLFALARRPADS